MPQNDPRRSGQSYSITLRPFTGRNSDIDQASIESNQASGGTNFTTVSGRLRRRPSMSRLGINLSLPGGTGISNEIHHLFSMVTGNGTILRWAGRGGMGEILSPSATYNGTGLASSANTPTSYTSGTISLSTGSRTVAGTNTSWLVRGIHPGASLQQGTQALRIRSVTNATSLELVALPTTGGTGLAYSVYRYRVPGQNAGGTAVATDENRTAMPLKVGVREAVTKVNATRLRNNEGSLLPGSRITQVTQGSRYVSLSAGTASSMDFNLNWLYLLADTGAEISGVTTEANRRVYNILGIERDSNGATTNRLVLSERFRGATGTGGGTYSTGARLNAGYAGMIDSNQYFWFQHTYFVAGTTVTVAAGSTTVNGTGTTWTADSVIAGDQIAIASAGKYHGYRIASVSSNTQLTIDSPFENGAVSGASPIISQFRRVSSTTAVNQNQQTLTMASSIRATTDGSFGIPFPILVGNNLTPSRRMQVAKSYLDDPIPNPSPISREYAVICSGDLTTTSRYNLWWTLPGSPDFSENQPGNGDRLIPVSKYAPRAKHVAFWAKRLFAADLVENYNANQALTSPFKLMWTRVGEAYSWWNQYPTDGAGSDMINDGSGDIMAMLPFGTINAIAVYREWGVTILHPTGDSINPFSKQYLNVGPGPVDFHAVVVYRGSHVYLARDGTIHAFDGNRMEEVPCPLTRYINDNITWNQAQWTMAVHLQNTYEIAWFIPTGTGRTLTEAIVWNYKDGDWYIWDFSSNPLWTVAAVDEIDNTSEKRLFGVTSRLDLVAFRSDGPGVDFVASIGGGTLFSSRWISKEMVLPIPDLTSEDREKEVNAVEVAYDPTYSGRLQMEVSGDGGINWTNFGTNTLTSGSTAGTSLSRGNGMVVGRTHMVRLTQTPANTTTDTSMSLRWLRIHYADYGAVPA